VLPARPAFVAFVCVVHVSIVDDYKTNCKRKTKPARRFLKKRRM
jgi:hypothetical protein